MNKFLQRQKHTNCYAQNGYNLQTHMAVHDVRSRVMSWMTAESTRLIDDSGRTVTVRLPDWSMHMSKVMATSTHRKLTRMARTEFAANGVDSARGWADQTTDKPTVLGHTDAFGATEEARPAQLHQSEERLDALRRATNPQTAVQLDGLGNAARPPSQAVDLDGFVERQEVPMDCDVHRRSDVAIHPRQNATDRVKCRLSISQTTMEDALHVDRQPTNTKSIGQKLVKG